MTNTRDRLDQVENELAEVRKHIAEERRIVRLSEAEGHSTRSAKKALMALHHFRDAIKRHRRILLKRLGL